MLLIFNLCPRWVEMNFLLMGLKMSEVFLTDMPCLSLIRLMDVLTGNLKGRSQRWISPMVDRPQEAPVPLLPPFLSAFSIGPLTA